MSRVSNSLSALDSAKNSCIQALAKLSVAAQKLQSDYRKAGQEWSDSKYQELGEIINSSVNALNSPKEELERCCLKIMDLAQAIREYESI